MINKRIGNTLNITWHVKTENEISLEDLDLMLQRREPMKTVSNIPFTIVDGELKFRHEGKEQKNCGKYTYTLWANFGKKNQAVVDSCDGYNLVPSTCLEGGDAVLDIEEDIKLRTVVLVVDCGGTVNVDSEFSLESENPVQNKVITKTLVNIIKWNDVK